MIGYVGIWNFCKPAMCGILQYALRTGRKQGLAVQVSHSQRHLEHAYLILQGLERVVNLRVLDVSNNRVAEVEGLESLHCLRDLWLNDNQLPTLDSIEAPARAGALGSTLTCLYVNGNPATAQDARQRENPYACSFPKARTA